MTGGVPDETEDPSEPNTAASDEPPADVKRRAGWLSADRVRELAVNEERFRPHGSSRIPTHRRRNGPSGSCGSSDIGSHTPKSPDRTASPAGYVRVAIERRFVRAHRAGSARAGFMRIQQLTRTYDG
jgi:hypothetical protein